MTARCKKCNQRQEFRNKRGSKLSDMTCGCGGSLELLSGIWTGDNMVYLNRKNEQFTLNVETMKFKREQSPN